ncbi:DciA family protein [Candidatus Cloacimonadota bacterium]
MALTRAGSALRDLAFKLAGDEHKNLVVLAFGWRSLLGDILAERAFIIKLENRILFVSVKNNVWMQELVLQKSELIKDIKRKFNIDLKNIVFSMDWENNDR